MYRPAACVMVQTWSELHIGVGQSPGVVDLPVYREPLTQWPAIPSAGLKGALRAHARAQLAGCAENPASRQALEEKDNTAEVASVFGPTRSSAAKHAGALVVTDAMLLLWPVRTLQGGFALVTCDAAIERANRLRALGGLAPLPLPPKLAPNQVICAAGFEVDQKVVMEEYLYVRASGPEYERWMPQFAAEMESAADADITRLACLHEEEFTHLARHGTAIRTHNALDYRTKNVQDGKLFQEETVPPEAVFLCVVMAYGDRSAGSRHGAQHVLETFERIVFGSETSTLISLGGNLTTGQGLCNLRVAERKGAAHA